MADNYGERYCRSPGCFRRAQQADGLCLMCGVGYQVAQPLYDGIRSRQDPRASSKGTKGVRETDNRASTSPGSSPARSAAVTDFAEWKLSVDDERDPVLHCPECDHKIVVSMLGGPKPLSWWISAAERHTQERHRDEKLRAALEQIRDKLVGVTDVGSSGVDELRAIVTKALT